MRATSPKLCIVDCFGLDYWGMSGPLCLLWACVEELGNLFDVGQQSTIRIVLDTKWSPNCYRVKESGVFGRIKVWGVGWSRDYDVCLRLWEFIHDFAANLPHRTVVYASVVKRTESSG